MVSGLVAYDDDSFSESEGLPKQKTIVRSPRRPSVPQILSILRRVGKQSEQRAEAICRMYSPHFLSLQPNNSFTIPSTSNAEVPSHYKTAYANPPPSPHSSFSRGKT